MGLFEGLATAAIPNFAPQPAMGGYSRPDPPCPPRRPSSALRIGWYHLSASNSAGVFSVMQDHRTYPAQLPSELLNVTFNELRSDPRLRVFQFHMGIGRDYVLQGDPAVLDTVELAYDDHGAPSQTVPIRVKLTAQRCIGLASPGATLRFRKVLNLQFGDYVVRCAFLIDDALALQLSDHERARASFDILACNDTVHFPLAEVLHFPQAEPIIQHGLLPRPADGFPSAPWASTELQVKRAHGSDAKLRVGAVVFKKFSWIYDDNLWLLWMLDVVGVDHVVISIATRDLPLSVVRNSIAQDKGLAERVTLVDLDFPSRKSNHSYSYLLQAQTHDLFLRWQADFDFIFLLDLDEYPQLFDTASTTQQPRVDIKTIIGLHRISTEQQGQVYFSRPLVQRTQTNSKPDPLLSAFLLRLAPLDGLMTSAVWSDKNVTFEQLGKGLFPVGAALRPYLHYNDYWPGRVELDWRASHVLHVGERRKGKPAPSLGEVFQPVNESR